MLDSVLLDRKWDDCQDDEPGSTEEGLYCGLSGASRRSSMTVPGRTDAENSMNEALHLVWRIRRRLAAGLAGSNRKIIYPCK